MILMMWQSFGEDFTAEEMHGKRCNQKERLFVTQSEAS